MSDKKELDWEEYEAITQYIYGALGVQYNIKVKGYGRNCKVTGKSGLSHQIDVLTEQFDAFSQEVQRRGELLKTTTITYPLNRTLFWNEQTDEISITKINHYRIHCQNGSKLQKILPPDRPGLDDHERPIR